MSNELDKQISDRLHNYQSEVDTEAIWAAVKPARKRRYWFLWFLLLGGVGIAGSSIWGLFNQGSSHAGYSNNLSIKKENILSEDTIECVLFINPIKTEIPTTNTIKANEKVGTSKIGNGLNALVKPPKNNSSSNNNAILLKEDNFKNISNNQKDSNQAVPIANKIEKESKEKKRIRIQQKAYHPLRNEKKTLSNTKNNVLQIKPINEYLPTLLGSLPEITPKLDHDFTFGHKVPAPANSTSPWSVQSDVAYLFIRRSLQSDSLRSWIDNRMETESTLEAWSIDVSVNYSFHKNWQIRAGFAYTQINTQFSFTNTSTVIDSVEGLQSIIFYPNNVVDSVYGPIGLTETIEHRQNIYNSFRQWETPILVGYQTQFERLLLIAEVGARIRIRRSWEGQLLNQNGEVAPLEDQQWYRDGVGISLQTGFHLGYQLAPQFQLRLGGNIRYSPVAFTQKDRLFKEGYQLGGIQLGIVYQLR